MRDDRWKASVRSVSGASLSMRNTSVSGAPIGRRAGRVELARDLVGQIGDAAVAVGLPEPAGALLLEFARPAWRRAGPCRLSACVSACVAARSTQRAPRRSATARRRDEAGVDARRGEADPGLHGDQRADQRRRAKPSVAARTGCDATTASDDRSRRSRRRTPARRSARCGRRAADPRAATSSRRRSRRPASPRESRAIRRRARRSAAASNNRQRDQADACATIATAARVPMRDAVDPPLLMTRAPAAWPAPTPGATARRARRRAHCSSADCRPALAASSLDQAEQSRRSAPGVRRAARGMRRDGASDRAGSNAAPSSLPGRG